MTDKKRLLLESTTCGRCAGTGRFSFNLMHGSRCYGCSGRGEVLTKRGKAAQAWLNEQRMIPCEWFKPGDMILSEGFAAGSYTEPTRWLRVVRVLRQTGAEAGYVNQPDLACVRIETEGGGAFVGYAGQSRFRRAMSFEEKRALHAAALAYQETLGKSGKPLKRMKPALNPSF